MTSQSGSTADQSRSTEVLPIQGETTVQYVPEPDRGTSWGRRLLLLLGTIVVVVGLVFGLKAVDLWPNWANPFATQTTDRSGPVLLQSMQDLSRYVAAEGNFYVLVDEQETKRFIPDFLFSERTLFVGVGSVDAYVDFSKLAEGAIVVSPDGKSVNVTLPAPVLEKPSIDTKRSYVFAQDKGISNKIGDFFGGDPNKQQRFYQLAEDKIAQAAQDSELRQRAETNTRGMLESMLHQLGYQKVTVTFAQP
jgi:hypothetical protein